MLESPPSQIPIPSKLIIENPRSPNSSSNTVSPMANIRNMIMKNPRCIQPIILGVFLPEKTTTELIMADNMKNQGDNKIIIVPIISIK